MLLARRNALAKIIWRVAGHFLLIGQGGGDEGFHRFRFRLFAPERDDGPRRQRGAQLQEF
jgi:hypothetical protein